MGIVWLGPKKRVRPGRLLLLPLLLLAEEEGCVHGFAWQLPRTALSQKSSSSSPYLVSPLRSTDRSDDAVVAPPALDASPQMVKVAKTERFSRLPVWPVWMGVVAFFVGRVLGPDWAAKLEDFAGGRVCPNFFDTSPSNTYDTSPFLMLVHHRHSFAAWDPIRWFQAKFILPEGFPAHPHRGFTTLTYFLRGGFKHRDSLGVAQSYGANNGQQHHSQWLFTGAGLLHEEMFDGSPQQELYQIWINAPASHKLAPPSVQLLGDHECPTIVDPNTGAETVVLAGEFGETAASTTPLHSPMTILHANVPPGQAWSYPSLPPSYETLVLYVRKGSCTIAGTEIPVHSTAYLDNPAAATTTTTPLLSVTASANDGVDFMLLAGEPLKEPVAVQGSMVMNHPSQIDQAYADYQRGFMGRPWDHALSDEDWNQHLQEFPCSYRYNDENDDENDDANEA